VGHRSADNPPFKRLELLHSPQCVAGSPGSLNLGGAADRGLAGLFFYRLRRRWRRHSAARGKPHPQAGSPGSLNLGGAADRGLAGLFYYRLRRGWRRRSAARGHTTSARRCRPRIGAAASRGRRGRRTTRAAPIACRDTDTLAVDPMELRNPRARAPVLPAAANSVNCPHFRR